MRVNDVLAHIMFLESFSGFSLCRIPVPLVKCDDQVSPIRAALLCEAELSEEKSPHSFHLVAGF